VRTPEVCAIIHEPGQAGIASTTEEATYFSGLVVMIHGKVALTRPTFTDCTLTSLCCEYELILLIRDAICDFQVLVVGTTPSTAQLFPIRERRLTQCWGYLRLLVYCRWDNLPGNSIPQSPSLRFRTYLQAIRYRAHASGDQRPLGVYSFSSLSARYARVPSS
jgi:hypothetical protein